MEHNDAAFGKSPPDLQGETPTIEQNIVIPQPPKFRGREKQQSPQAALDEFWAKFHTKHPGKGKQQSITLVYALSNMISFAVSTILPRDVYTRKVGKNAPKGTTKEENALASHDEAVEICKAKVAKIVEACQRANCKYSDPDFNIELDLKYRIGDCLEPLSLIPRPDFKERKLPRSVKRVRDVFDDPKFYIGGPTPNDVRQGGIGNCWLLAALCAMGNKPGPIEKVCVARSEDIGVYGFCVLS
jgi:hypothetical protein